VGATISVGGHVGYRWGGAVQTVTVAYCVGMLASLVVLVMAGVAAVRRRQSLLALWIVLAVAFVLLGASASF
jgi:hypothetical protein